MVFDWLYTWRDYTYANYFIKNNIKGKCILNTGDNKRKVKHHIIITPDSLPVVGDTAKS